VSGIGAPAGNKYAAKAKIWEQAIKRALARKSNDSVDKGLDTLADKLVEAAQNGDQWALREVGDRMDGKPAQAIIGDDDAPPIRIQKVERVLVRPDTADRDG
jgi:hypothetical protein